VSWDTGDRLIDLTGGTKQRSPDPLAGIEETDLEGKRMGREQGGR